MTNGRGHRVANTFGNVEGGAYRLVLEKDVHHPRAPKADGQPHELVVRGSGLDARVAEK